MFLSILYKSIMLAASVSKLERPYEIKIKLNKSVLAETYTLGLFSCVLENFVFQSHPVSRGEVRAFFQMFIGTPPQA